MSSSNFNIGGQKGNRHADEINNQKAKPGQKKSPISAARNLNENWPSNRGIDPNSLPIRDTSNVVPATRTPKDGQTRYPLPPKKGERAPQSLHHPSLSELSKKYPTLSALSQDYPSLANAYRNTYGSKFDSTPQQKNTTPKNEDSWVGTNANLFDDHNEGDSASETKSLFGISEKTSPQTNTTTPLPSLPSISEEPEKQNKITNPGSSPLEELLLNFPRHEDSAPKAGNSFSLLKKMPSGISTVPPLPSLPSISEEPEEPSDSSPKASSDSESNSGTSLEANGASGNPKIVESNIRSQKQSIGSSPMEDSSKLNKKRNPQKNIRIITPKLKRDKKSSPSNPPSNRP